MPVGTLALVRGLAEGRAVGVKACFRLPVDAVLRLVSPAPGSDLAGSVDLAPTMDRANDGAAAGGLCVVVGLALLAVAPPKPTPNSTACFSAICRSASNALAAREAFWRSLSASSFSLE